MLNIMLLSLRSVSAEKSLQQDLTVLLEYIYLILVELTSSDCTIRHSDCSIRVYRSIKYNFPNHFSYYTSIMLDAFVVIENKGKLCM